MKVIIVDDEPRAIKLIEGYLEHFKKIILLATFRNGLKAMEFLEQQSVDLVFLDINMPHISGLTLASMIDKSSKVVFTTAYSEYAVESYESEAFDYLLKPISFDRFAKTMNRVFEEETNMQRSNKLKLTLKSGAKMYRVNVNEILYLKKDGNYMTYHLVGRNILSRQTISEALRSLSNQFIQVHKSYILNIEKIKYWNKEEIAVADTSIPIGYSFKQKVINRLTPK